MSNFNTYDYWYTNIYNEQNNSVGGGVYLGRNYILTSVSALLDHSIRTSDINPFTLNDDGLMFDISVTSDEDANTAFYVKMGENSELLFEQTYQVDEITIHPEFRRDYVEFRGTDGNYVSIFTGYSNDIAILALNKNPSLDLFNQIDLLPEDSTIISSDRIVAGTQLKSYGVGNDLRVYDPYEGIYINTIEDSCISTIPDVPVIIASDYYEEGTTITQQDLTVPQSDLWMDLTKIHAKQFRKDTILLNTLQWAWDWKNTLTVDGEINTVYIDPKYVTYPFTHTNLSVYKVDYSKNSNLDSSDEVATQVHNLLASDMLLLQSSDFYSDSLLLQNRTDLQTIDYIANGTKNSIRSFASDLIGSDEFFDNKFFAEIDNTGDIDVNLVIFKTGTPIVYADPVENYVYLAGIFNRSSANIDSGIELNDENLPSIFTDITKYRSWINDTINLLEIVEATINLNRDYIYEASIYSTSTSDILYDLQGSGVFTVNASDEVTITDTTYDWETVVYPFSTDVSKVLDLLEYWSSDLAMYHDLLLIYSSDGSSDYATGSDLMDSAGTYITTLEGNSMDTINTHLTEEGTLNVTQAGLFIEHAMETNSVLEQLSSDAMQLHDTLIPINQQITDQVINTKPDDFRDSVFRQRVTNPTVVFSSNSFYDPEDNSGRNELFGTTVVGNAQINHSEKSYFSLTVTDHGDHAVRQTITYIPTQVGYGKTALIAGVLLSEPSLTNFVEARMGMFDGQNGHCVKLDRNGLSFSELASGLELNVLQRYWNLDKMDGSGPSGINLNQYVISNGGVPQVFNAAYRHMIIIIDTQWTGITRMGFYLNGIPRYCHQFTHEHYKWPANSASSLPIRYEIMKTDKTDTETAEMRMTWCTVIIEGQYVPYFNKFSYTNARDDETIITPSGIGAEAALVPVFSLRLKEDFRKAAAQIAQLQLNLTTSNNIYWELIQNAELQNDTWLIEPDAQHGSMIKIDTTATSYERGYIMKEGLLSGNSGVQTFNFVDDLHSYITEPKFTADIEGNTDTITFAIKNLSGGTQPELWFVIQWVEMY